MPSTRRLSRFALSLTLLLSFTLTLPALAQKGSKARQAAAQEDDQPKKGKGKSAGNAKAVADAPADKNAAKKLRAEWDLATLKLTRDAVDEASFPADIKSAAGQAVDWFLSQQESLLADVQKNPQNAPKAQAQRNKLKQTFEQRMSAVYNNPALMKELGKQLRAMQKEMEDMCVSADKVFQRLDAVGCTPEQKKKIAPVVAEAQQKINNARNKNEKEEAVENYKQARNKLRQNLTPAQKEALKKKLADEA